MAQTLMTAALTLFALAAGAFVVTIICFFALDIRGLIDELNGKTATDQIARIRAQGATRQHKGRSLQSIVAQGQAQARFQAQAQSQAQTQVDSDSRSAQGLVAQASELRTSILSGKTTGASEQKTTFLGAGDARQ